MGAESEAQQDAQEEEEVVVVELQEEEEGEEEEEEEEARVCGTLHKRGARFPYAWQSRHVAFLASTGTLCYFKQRASEKGHLNRADTLQSEASYAKKVEPEDGFREEEQPPSTSPSTPSPAPPAPRRAAMEPRGALVLTALRPDPKDPTALAFVGVDGRVMLAKAPGAAEAQRWLEALAAFVPAPVPAEPAAADAPDASAPAAPSSPVSPVADYDSVLYTPKAQEEAATEAAMEAAPTGAAARRSQRSLSSLPPSPRRLPTRRWPSPNTLHCCHRCPPPRVAKIIPSPSACVMHGPRRERHGAAARHGRPWQGLYDSAAPRRDAGGRGIYGGELCLE